MEKVRIGVIGLGRGLDMIRELYKMEDAEVRVICDKDPARIDRAKDLLKDTPIETADTTVSTDELFAREDVDAVIIATSWNDHTNLAVQAMKAGKFVGLEIGPLADVEQCYELIRAEEETGSRCMVLENCCYGRYEMKALNMIKKGLFGEVVHVGGGYQHACKDMGIYPEQGGERGFHYLKRDFHFYPTHDLGPLMTYLNINHGNRMLYLSSFSSKSASLNEHAAEKLTENDAFYGKRFKNGDYITTLIKCAGGETISLQLNTTLPRPYSRMNSVSGTKGMWNEDTGYYFEGKTDEKKKWDAKEEYEEYEHPLWKAFQKTGITGSHGGMDYIMLRAFVRSIIEHRPFPIDIYDGATLLSISALSEESIALGSRPVYIPDFTKGRWVNREEPDPTIFTLFGDINDELYKDLTKI